MKSLKIGQHSSKLKFSLIEIWITVKEKFPDHEKYFSSLGWCAILCTKRRKQWISNKEIVELLGKG